MKIQIKLFILLLISLVNCNNIAVALEVEQSTNVAFCNVNAEAVLNMADSFTLATNDKDHNGHTILRHVAKGKAALVERLLSNTALETVTTYANINIANEAIKAGIKLDAARIARWLSTPDATYSLVLYFHAKDSLGYGISRKSMETILPLSNFVIVLRKHSECTFRVLTSYPSEPYVHIAKEYDNK